MSDAARMDETGTAQAWQDYCTALADAGAVILAEDAPAGALDRAEGFRYLSRLSRLALEQYVEASDPDFPFFYSLSHTTAKIGADNPDNVYLNASIKGSNDYRITGKRGSMFYFSIVANAMRYHIDGSAHATGSLMDSDIAWGPNGEVEIIASCNPPSGADTGKLWLRLEPDTSVIIIRQSALDRATEEGGTFHIERINGPATPAPLTAERLHQGLAAAGQFVRGVAATFADWTRLFRQYPNSFPELDQMMFQKGGGAKDIFYAHAYWALAPDEAWLIEVTPPDCYYWNFQLNNWWMESLDYRFQKVTVNKHDAVLGADGVLRILCSDMPPQPRADRPVNWLDTCGHREGTALLRWAGANAHPLPTTRVIKISEWEHLP